MVSKPHKTLYTLGFSSYDVEKCIEQLKKYNITAIADVRSSPYSAYYKDYNREELAKKLQHHQIHYVFLGKELGARQTAPSVYREGRAIYELIAKLPSFQHGLTRLQNGLFNYNIALLCAEKDPMTCHRAILICRNLREKCSIIHLWPHEENGKLVETETHQHLEQRLVNKYDKGQLSLLADPVQQLEDAYQHHGYEVAFTADLDQQKFED